jgi:hypothetical protein
MAQAPQWTQAEFELVLESGSKDSGELADLLPRRSVGAIEWVRAGIHSYHLGGDISMLAQMMRDRLADSTRPVKCPICGAVVNPPAA